MSFATLWARQSTPDRIVAIGAVLLLVDSFLPWYSVEYYRISESANGWNKTLPILAVLVALGVVALKVLADAAVVSAKVFEAVKWPHMRLIGCSAVALFVLLEMLTAYEYVDRAFGVYVGVLCAAAMLAASIPAVNSKFAATPRVTEQ